VADVLIYGDTLRSPELRHEVAVPIPDGFLYAERNGRRVVAIHSLEVPRLRGTGLDILSWDDLGWEELLDQGVGRDELYLHIAERSCRVLGLDTPSFPPAFPSSSPITCAPPGSSSASIASTSRREGASRTTSSWPASGGRSGRPRRRWTPRATFCGVRTRAARC
jgi:hypothetical protein